MDQSLIMALIRGGDKGRGQGPGPPYKCEFSTKIFEIQIKFKISTLLASPNIKKINFLALSLALINVNDANFCLDAKLVSGGHGIWIYKEMWIFHFDCESPTTHIHIFLVYICPTFNLQKTAYYRKFGSRFMPLDRS